MRESVSFSLGFASAVHLLSGHLAKPASSLHFARSFRLKNGVIVSTRLPGLGPLDEMLRFAQLNGSEVQDMSTTGVQSGPGQLEQLSLN